MKTTITREELATALAGVLISIKDPIVSAGEGGRFATGSVYGPEQLAGQIFTVSLRRGTQARLSRRRWAAMKGKKT